MKNRLLNMEKNINGKINNRITIALDDTTYKILNSMKKKSSSSKSELIRKAIKFYYEFKNVLDSGKEDAPTRINTYLELLSHGEHVILDIDHYLSFLKFIENSPDRDKFWEVNKSIGKAHAEEFSQDFDISTAEEVMERLETCNFFKIVKDSSNRFTLLLGSDIQKNFIKTFLKEVLTGMDFKVQIKEGFSKLKVILSK